MSTVLNLIHCSRRLETLLKSHKILLEIPRVRFNLTYFISTFIKSSFVWTFLLLILYLYSYLYSYSICIRIWFPSYLLYFYYFGVWSSGNGCDDTDALILGRGGFDGTTVATWSPVTRTDIAWNFEKFLFDKDGKLVKRYSRYYPTKDIKKDIDALL